MSHNKAFILVGHSNWGKSTTLRQLLPGNARRQSWTKLNSEVWIFIKRMSNDDIPDELLKFVRQLDPNRKPIIIIALCPDFSEDSKKTKLILEFLRKKYSLFFFVLKKKWDGTAEITRDEIETLRSYGSVEILSQQSDYRSRGAALRKFVVDHL